MSRVAFTDELMGRESSYKPFQGVNLQEHHQVAPNHACYTCMLFIYLVISAFSAVLKTISMPFEDFNQTMVVGYYYLIVLLWAWGLYSRYSLNSKFQWIFQTLLIIYMLFSLIDLFSILQTSYIYNPVLTFSMLSYAALSGVLVPFFLYSQANNFRKELEEMEKRRTNRLMP